MNTAFHILVIDHDPAGRKATRTVLETAGYSTDGAASAAGGLRLARRHLPALVLLDADLPNVDGIKACQQMKADPHLAGTFVVLFSTGAADSRRRVRGLKAGAVEFLTCPIADRELLARIQALVRIQAAGAARLQSNGPESSGDAAFTSPGDAGHERADDTLREAHDRLLMVLDSLPADVYVADMNTFEILFMNQHMRTSFGGNLVGQICWKPFRGAAGPCPHCTNDRLVDAQGNPTGGVTWEGQNPLTRRWYTNYDRAIRWVNGELVRVQIAVDITEKKQADAVLQEKERLLSDTQRIAQIGSWLYDLAADQVTWSEETYRIYGVSPESFVPTAESLISLLHPDDQPVMGAWIADGLAGNPSPAIEIRTIRPDGAVRILLGQGEVLFDDDHRPFRMIGTVQDITERKQVETELSLKNKQLTMLNQLGQAQNRLAPLPEILERISNLIGQVFDNRNLYIALYDEATNFVSFPIYWMVGERRDLIEGRPLGNGLTEYVIRTRAPLLIPGDMQAALAERGIALVGTICKCYLGVPILIDENVIGAIAVQDYEHENVFTANHVELLSTIASQAASSIKNARLYETLQQELTERKRAEDALRESENRYKAVSELISDYAYAFRVEPDGKLASEWVTGALALLTGYTGKELQSRGGWEQLIYPEDMNIPLDQLKSLLSNNTKTVEYRIATKSGEVRWMRDYARPVWDTTENRVTKIEGAIQDITERKQAETALQKSEESYRTLAEVAQDMIVVVNRQWQIEYANAHAARQFGGSPQELVGKQLAGLFPSEIASRQQNNLQRVFDSGQPVYVEAPSVFHGETIWLGTWLAPIKDQDDRANTILVVSRDITERKQMEEILRESEEKMRSIFRVAPTGIGVVRGRILLEVNPRICEMTGYSAEELIGQSARMLYPTQEDFDYVGREKYQQIAQKGSGDVETRWRRKDGSIIDIRLASTPIDVSDLSRGVTFTALDITDGKRAEKLLLESQDLFTEFMLHSPIYTFIKAVTPVESRVLMASDNYRDMIGISSSDMVGKTMQELFPAEFAAKITADDWAVTCGDQVLKLDEDLNGRNYTTIKFPIFQGGRYLLAGYSIDITERKQAELEIVASLERERSLGNLVRDASVAIAIGYPDGHIGTCNLAFQKLTGYSEEELQRTSWNTVLTPPEWRESELKALAELSHKKSRVIYQKEYIHKSGKRIPIELVVHPFYDSDGELAYYYAFITDITERKRVEDEIRLRAEQLSVLYNLGRVVNASLSVKQISGAGVKAILNAARPDRAFLFWREGERLILKEELPHAGKKRSGQVPEHRVGMCLCGLAAEENKPVYSRNIRTDRRCTWEECKQAGFTSFAALPLRSGEKVVGVIGLASKDDHDFETQSEFLETLASQLSVGLVNAQLFETTQHYAADLEQRVEERTQALRDAQEQLVRQEKLAVLGQLAGGVGHELRNPLTVINNAVYYLKLVQPDADEKIRDYLGMIEKETHSAEKIISDLLDFARIKSVDREPVVAADLVRHVLERHPVPESITAALKFPDGLPKAYADPRQVEQVLGNLVVNAYQAMPSGGRLKIAATRRKDELAIAVSDTGAGISPENMIKLFEPLFTTKPRGIGLGLAVSRKLAEANGGRIEVQSEPGKGASFTLFLPVQVMTHG